MIPRFGFLFSVWRRAPCRVLLSSRSTHQLPLVSPSFSNMDSMFATEEAPLEVEENDEFASKKIDYLEQSIEAARTTDQVLAIVERHAEIMNHDHIFGCIKKIVPRPRADLLVERLIESDAFEIALETVAQHVEHFDGGELYELLMLLMKLEVPPSAQVFEGICTELRSKLNDPALNLRMLLTLTRTLPKLSAPSTQILRHTVPVAIQFRLKEELDLEDMRICASYFEYILVNTTDEATLDFIAEAALRHCHSFSLDRAVSILLSNRVRLQGTTIYAPKQKLRGSKISKVLSVCMGIVARNMNSVTDGKLRALVWSCKYHGVLTDEFLTGVWRRASNWSPKALLSLLCVSVKNDFMTLLVANWVVSWYLNQHDEIAQVMTSDLRVTCMATAFATAAVHNAAGTDEQERALRAARRLMDFVEERRTLFKNGSPALANFLKQLCVCGIYSWHYLDQAFEPTSQEGLFSLYPHRVNDLRQLEEIVGYKDSSRYTIRQDALFRHSDMRVLTWNLMMPVLTKVANHARLITNLEQRSKKLSDLHIDVILAVSRDGTLLEIPGELRDSVCLEELPPDSKVVAIALENATHFSSGLIKPWFAWKQKCLRDEGFCPIIVQISPERMLRPEDWNELIREALRQGPEVSDKAIRDSNQLDSSRANDVVSQIDSPSTGNVSIDKVIE